MLTLVIRIYWALWPARLRRQCLFKESCSHFVFRQTQTDGLLTGLNALRYRMRVCNGRSRFFINPITLELNIELPDGEVLSQGHINEAFVEQHRKPCELILP
ncbi:MAG TPA: membrane protein insertion efficiency factor YidD [Chryseolinea sp.]|nr:membrane protein insertion efficiency factor YidD [Chryseolinea sp.]